MTENNTTQNLPYAAAARRYLRTYLGLAPGDALYREAEQRFLEGVTWRFFFDREPPCSRREAVKKLRGLVGFVVEERAREVEEAAERLVALVLAGAIDPRNGADEIRAALLARLLDDDADVDNADDDWDDVDNGWDGDDDGWDENGVVVKYWRRRR